MIKYLHCLLILLLLPAILFASMTQKDLDKLYVNPIIVGAKQRTININLPVDSTDGYRWFLNSPNYDYIRSTKFSHDSVDVDNSKWGGMDNFKFSVTDRFKKSPQKIILHFDCFKPWDVNPTVVHKDVVILSVNE